MYFTEGHYLYTLAGSSGRGVLTSGVRVTSVSQSGMPVGVINTLKWERLRHYDWWLLLQRMAYGLCFCGFTKTVSVYVCM